MRRIGMILGSAALLLTIAPGPQHPLALAQAPPAVSVKAVTYDQLGQVVKRLKGKVVIVDFWGIT